MLDSSNQFKLINQQVDLENAEEAHLKLEMVTDKSKVENIITSTATSSKLESTQSIPVPAFDSQPPIKESIEVQLNSKTIDSTNDRPSGASQKLDVHQDDPVKQEPDIESQNVPVEILNKPQAEHEEPTNLSALQTFGRSCLAVVGAFFLTLAIDISCIAHDAVVGGCVMGLGASFLGVGIAVGATHLILEILWHTKSRWLPMLISKLTALQRWGYGSGRREIISCVEVLDWDPCSDRPSAFVCRRLQTLLHGLHAMI